MTDRSAIIDLLGRCDTLRLGLIDGNRPYVVPISFGMDVQDDQIVLYFHGAKKGLKIDCIRSNPNVCVEGDIFIKTEAVGHGITTRYESVIGFGTACEVEGEDKMHGLKTILDHYGYSDYPLDETSGVCHACVYKIVLTSVTGKHNLP